MHCISPLFVVYGTDWCGSWQLMRPVNLIPKSASDGFATLLFRAFSEVCFKCGASVPPPKAPSHQNRWREYGAGKVYLGGGNSEATH